MSRSVKKGPFVDPKLLRRIEDMNAANEKKVVIHGRERLQSSLRWWDTRLPFTTAENMCLYTLRKTWSDTSSENLHRQELTEAMPRINRAGLSS